MEPLLSNNSCARFIFGHAETFDVGIIINGNPKGEPAIEAVSVTTPAIAQP